jgi:hypothetical protein
MITSYAPRIVLSILVILGSGGCAIRSFSLLSQRRAPVHRRAISAGAGFLALGLGISICLLLWMDPYAFVLLAIVSTLVAMFIGAGTYFHLSATQVMIEMAEKRGDSVPTAPQSMLNEVSEKGEEGRNPSSNLK